MKVRFGFARSMNILYEEYWLGDPSYKTALVVMAHQASLSQLGRRTHAHPVASKMVAVAMARETHKSGK